MNVPVKCLRSRHSLLQNAAGRTTHVRLQVILEDLRALIAASRYINLSIDDSSDNASMEQCCIVIYLLNRGRREEHLLKFHALPGASATGADIKR